MARIDFFFNQMILIQIDKVNQIQPHVQHR